MLLAVHLDDVMHLDVRAPPVRAEPCTITGSLSMVLIEISRSVSSDPWFTTMTSPPVWMSCLFDVLVNWACCSCSSVGLDCSSLSFLPDLAGRRSAVPGAAGTAGAGDVVVLGSTVIATVAAFETPPTLSRTV